MLWVLYFLTCVECTTKEILSEDLFMLMFLWGISKLSLGNVQTVFGQFRIFLWEISKLSLEDFAIFYGEFRDFLWISGVSDKPRRLLCGDLCKLGTDWDWELLTICTALPDWCSLESWAWATSSSETSSSLSNDDESIKFHCIAFKKLNNTFQRIDQVVDTTENIFDR